MINASLGNIPITTRTHNLAGTVSNRNTSFKKYFVANVGNTTKKVNSTQKSAKHE